MTFIIIDRELFACLILEHQRRKRRGGECFPRLRGIRQLINGLRMSAIAHGGAQGYGWRRSNERPSRK